MNLTEWLTLDEGLRLKPYTCTAGKLTIGIGRNIEDNGITVEEAEMMLENDIQSISAELFRRFPWVLELDDARKDALVNMAFNMGVPRLAQFSKMSKAINEMDFESAADEALDSRWARQVGARAERIAHVLRHGDYEW